MKFRILLFCIAIVAICLWLMLHHSSPPPSASVSSHAAATTNQSSVPAPGVVAMTSGQSNPASVSTTLSAPPTNMPTTINPTVNELLQKPIDFYGQVLDESNNPVMGASVAFRWDDLTATDWTRTATTSSDAEGLFSLRNKRGATLTVLVSKDGYYTPQSGQGAFHYATGNPNFSSDPHNPTVFYLRKKGNGTPLIEKNFPPGMGQIWQLHHDGTPIELDLLSGSQNTFGSGQLKLEFWRDVSDMNKQPFDWKLQLSVTGGGLVETDQEFPFEAPASGYQPSIEIEMPVTNQNWIGELRATFYIQLPNGNYGRFNFYLLPHNGVFIIKSCVNPTGLRNLELPP